MAIDLNRLLQTGASLLPSLLRIPNALAGAGLLTAGGLMDKEPGEVLEARQFLRNRFTSPTALSEQFSGQIGGLMQQFQPFLTQQRQRGLADVSQRFAAAFPKTVGAQGPEFGALSRFITDEALPREQAVLGDIGRQLLTEQGAAAGKILETSKPDPFAAAISQLGGLLVARDLFGGQGGQGGLGGGILGSDGASLLTPGNALAPGGIGELMAKAVGLANTTGNTTQLAQLLASGVLRGMPFPIGLQASTPAGQVIQQAINAGLVESPAAQLAGSGGAAAGSSAIGLAGTAAASGVVGFQIGKQFKGGAGTSATRAKGGLGGAAGGAATGAAIGSVIPGVGTAIGAAIGAIVGGISGIFGSSSAEKARKQASIQAEIEQTNAQRPAALQSAEQYDASTNKFRQQFLPIKVPLEEALETLRGDPNVQAVIQRATSAFPISTSTGAPVPPHLQANPPMDWVINALLHSAGPEGENFPNTGPESAGGLLHSTETGKFSEGLRKLNLAWGQTKQAQDLLTQLIALARQKGAL